MRWAGVWQSRVWPLGWGRGRAVERQSRWYYCLVGSQLGGYEVRRLARSATNRAGTLPSTPPEVSRQGSETRDGYHELETGRLANPAPSPDQGRSYCLYYSGSTWCRGMEAGAAPGEELPRSQARVSGTLPHEGHVDAFGRTQDHGSDSSSLVRESVRREPSSLNATGEGQPPGALRLRSTSGTEIACGFARQARS